MVQRNAGVDMDRDLSVMIGCCRTYTVHWMTEKAGDYLITGWLEGSTVGGCAKACAVQPAALDASHCSCAGEGLSTAVAGLPATFTVTACDRCVSQHSMRRAFLDATSILPPLLHPQRFCTLASLSWLHVLLQTESQSVIREI